MMPIYWICADSSPRGNRKRDPLAIDETYPDPLGLFIRASRNVLKLLCDDANFYAQRDDYLAFDVIRNV